MINLDDYPHEEAARLMHEAAKALHGQIRPLLNSRAIETAASETAKLLEKAPLGSLMPYDMAAFCISTYFAALPMEFEFPKRKLNARTRKRRTFA